MDYTKIFKVIYENIKLFLNIGETYMVQEGHTDFEITIGKECKNVYQK